MEPPASPIDGSDSAPSPPLRRPLAVADDNDDELIDSESISDDDEPPALAQASCGDEAPTAPLNDGEELIDSASSSDDDEPPAFTHTSCGDEAPPPPLNDADELIDSASTSDDDEPPLLAHASCEDEAPPPLLNDGDELLDSESISDDEAPALEHASCEVVCGDEVVLITDDDDEEEDAVHGAAGSGDDGDEAAQMAEDDEDEPPVIQHAAVGEDASGNVAVQMVEDEDFDDDDEPPIITEHDGDDEDAMRMAEDEEEGTVLKHASSGGDACADEAVHMPEDEEEDEPPITEQAAESAGGIEASGDEAVRMVEDENEEEVAVPDHTVDGAGEDACGDKAVQMTEDEPSPPVQAGTAAKRKRGRPRKVRVEVALEEEAVQMVENEAETPAATVKRGRGRPPKAQGGRRAPAARKENEEAVCFICFDGGELVICDRRGCTKVYHAGCVNRDESYFRTKGRWNCGWHICSICEKAAHFMCYTCTYSLCKACNRGAGFVCIRGNKGFCESCYTTVMTIESNKHKDEEQVDVIFNDKTSWNYLFRIYWSQLKGKLSLTLDELTAAKNRQKKSVVVTGNEDSSDESYDVNDDQEISSESSSEHYEGRSSSRKKATRRSENAGDEESSVKQVENGAISNGDNTKWASNELLEFVSHMRDGDTSSLSQFDVQALLLEYIKKNNLRDPRKKSQIICDPMLQKLFQKERVGHFEMLKLLESHFLMKEASQVITDNNQGGILDTDSVQMDDEGYNDAAAKFSSDKKRKPRKRVEEREPQTNVDDYAAIDVHNINLMYLRRSLMEELVDDTDNFREKVIGSFVRIRIPATDRKQDMYRLVQVVGTHVASEKYKIGKKTTDIILEILNLDKTEAVTIETVSNQEFTEEECRRLRQSIKCGLISRLTVGQVQEKSRILQAVRVDDWLESEKLRVGHLRDRASEKGRRKELRECVEKLQLLNTPEERWRRLNDVPEIHADPKMDPAYESVDEEESDDKKNRDNFRKSNDSLSLRIGRHLPFPGKVGSVSGSSWSSARKSSQTHREVNRSPAVEGAWDKTDSFSSVGDKTSELFSSQGKGEGHFSWGAQNAQANTAGMEAGGWNNNQHAVVPEQTYGIARETTTASLPTGVSVPSVTSETEKMWYYHDPSGKVQGPFSMTQLRKWNTTGYFPPELRIWRTHDKQDDYILLTDALIGKFQKAVPQQESQHNSFSQPIKGAMASMNSAWVDSNQNQGNWNSVRENAIFSASGNTELGNTSRWSNQSIVWSPKTEMVNPMGGRIVSRGWEASRDANTWSGQAQTHSSFRPTAPFSGNNYDPLPLQGRGGGRGGNAGRWNRGQDRGSSWNLNRSEGLRPNGQDYEMQQSNWNTSGQQPANDSKQWGNDLLNPPTPTPQLARDDWANVQGTVNTSPASLTASNKEAMSNSVGDWDPCSASPFMPGNAKKTDGWGSWSPISHKAKVAEPVNASPTPVSSGWGNHQTFSEQKRPQCSASGIPENESPLPMGRTNVSDSAIITSGSNISELSGALNKNQFFQGDCPSPTPLCERQELLVVQEDHDSATAAPALVASDSCARLSSEMNNGLYSPLNVAAETLTGIEPTVDSDSAQRPGASSGLKSVSETEGRDPALYQKGEPNISSSSSVPSEKWDLQQSQKLSDTNGSEWSLPSPTPSSKPPSWDLGGDSVSGNRQSNPWMSSDGSKLSPTTLSGIGWDHHLVSQNASKSIVAAQGDTKGSSGRLGESLPLANTDTNSSWGAPSQGNTKANTGWGASTQGNKNTSSGWGLTSPGSTNAGAGRTSSIPGNTAWGAPLQGSTNLNTGWGAPPNGNNANPGWGVQTQRNSNQNSGWEAPANGNVANSSWGTPAQGNPNQNPGWGNQNQNVNWGAPAPQGNGNVNGGWVAGHGNRNSWGAHQSGDRYDRGDNVPRNGRMQSGGGGGSSRPPPRGRGQAGICKFHESGYCKKGSSCNYRHI